MKALIDGDSLVYTLGFACQQIVHQAQTADGTPICEHLDKQVILDWIEKEGHAYPGIQLDKRINVSPPEHAYHTVKIVVQKICQAAKANSYVVYLTGGGNFRDGLATIQGYKHNRKDKEKPALYEHIRWYLQAHHGAKMIEGMEADDALSIVYTRAFKGEPVNVSKDPSKTVMKYPEECIICAIDKDLRTVPGTQVNFNNKIVEADGRYKRVVVTEEDADRNFYKQLLMGDSADNILGIPRVGPKKADGILAGLTTGEEMFDACWEAYKAHYGTEWFDYYRYDAYVDTTAAYTKRELKPEDQILPEQILQGHALTMLLENARLLYMLRTPISQDGSHWWMPPRSFDELMAEPEQAEASEEPSPDTDLPFETREDGTVVTAGDLNQCDSCGADDSAPHADECPEIKPECVTSDNLVTEPKVNAPEVAPQEAQGGDEGESSASPNMADPEWHTAPWWAKDLS